MSQNVFSFGEETHSFNNNEVLYFPNYFKENYLPILKKKLNWQSDEIQMFGKVHPIPRLHCWYADQEVAYEYSNIKLTHNPWIKVLEEIKTRIESKNKYVFNGMLGNYYRNGEDYVSWHSDDEISLGDSPVIACASFGVTRVFSLRNKKTKEIIKLNLEDKSLLLMLPPTQRDWEHQIHKSKTVKDERISLTFRFVHQ